MRSHLYSKNLKAFAIIAREHSFSRAAKLLHVSPSALQKRIDSFENDLKISLFYRSARGLKLTAAGQKLLEFSDLYIKKAELFLHELQDINNDDILSVGVSALIDAQNIIELFLRHQNELKDIKLKLVPFENEPNQALHILQNLGSNIDLVAGIYDDNFLKLYNIDAYFLYTTPLILCLPQNHPLNGTKTLEITNLKNCSVLVNQEGVLEVFDKARLFLTSHGVKIIDEKHLSLESFNKAYQYGYAILNIAQWSHVHPLFKPHTVNWDLSADLGIIHAKKPKRSVQKFLQTLKQNPAEQF